MIPPAVSENNEPGSQPPGKKPVMAIVIISILLIIEVIAIVFVLSPAGSSPVPAPAVVKETHILVTPQAVRAPAAASPVKPVDFVIQPGAQEKCGLTCRQLTPSITNTGNETAHNVCISITLYNSGGELIFLNGGSSIKKCIGTIASGETKSEPIIIEADCGFFASKCLQKTLVLKTRATCDETTVQFPDRTIAV